MRSRLFVAAAAIARLLAAAVFATQAQAAEAPRIVCPNAATQREIEECLVQEFKTADRALADAYTHYLRSVSETQRPLLEKAQVAWKTYREADCRAAAAVNEGGTMEGAAFAGCELEVTRNRLDELKRIYEEPPFPSTTTVPPAR